MIFITFKRLDKTCSKYKKTWFLLIHLLAKQKTKQNSKTNEKIQKQLSRILLKYSARFTEKHLLWSLFLAELQV